ncbi:alpha/beta-Hydrolases superfamily protein [Euphorbia peplus]|nr:alpha/beta-Hydrolases superfamily protein [Euphorbia peplus]
MMSLAFQQLILPSYHHHLNICHPKFQSNRFLARASSSSAASVSGSEQWLDPKLQQQRNKRIAGIDQEQLLDPTLLADPDSCFCEFKGVHIHHKVVSSAHESSQLVNTTSQQLHPKIDLPIILLHGFGASLFSWGRVMKRLAEVTGSKVLAFDRPAFGLTSRVDPDAKSLNPYSMAFSVLVTLYFIDFLTAERTILVGHSAGSLVAVDSYLEAPERVAALILVAPALLAPRSVRKVAERNKEGRGTQTTKDGSNLNSTVGKQFSKFLDLVLKLTAIITGPIIQMAKGITSMLNSLYKKALSAVLRSTFGAMLIRMVIDKFGIAAVRNAWHDSSQVTEHVLDGYTKPLRVKGWDKALAEFTSATLASFDSEPKPSLSKRLHEITCPVLIITGDNDRIVPSWNAKRLSEAIPGSCLEVIKHCGHLPHEEKVEEFVSVVENFLQRNFCYLVDSSQKVTI